MSGPYRLPSNDGGPPRFDLDANFAGSVGRFGTFRSDGSPGAFGDFTPIVESFELVENRTSMNGVDIRQFGRHSDQTVRVRRLSKAMCELPLA